jgi:protocatechuate 3,4-dioxygenase beta subunit
MSVIEQREPSAQESERLRAIWARTVAALQEVVRELKITQDELHVAGRYFNRLGQSGMFPSLVDVSLAMTSVDATARTPGGTRPNLEGPFHKSNPPFRSDGNLLEREPPPGAPRLTLTGQITDAATGLPLPGAELDIWQADHEGHYDLEGTHLSGLIRADNQGRYAVTTVVPRDYSDHDHDPIGELYRALGRHNRRAAHIHVKVRLGGKELLNTQLFIEGNEYLDTDYVVGAVSDDLIVKLRPAREWPGGAPSYEAAFDFAVAPAKQIAAA